MFFELDGKTFGVKFSRLDTTTLAEWIEVGEKGIVHTGVYGIATLHYKDRFEKKVGRKVALTHLLTGLDEQWLPGRETLYPIHLTKADRATIWAEYFKSHKK